MSLKTEQASLINFVNFPLQNKNEFFVYDQYTSTFIVINNDSKTYSFLAKKEKITLSFSTLSPITAISIDDSFLYLTEVHLNNVVIFRSIKRNISSVIFQSENDRILSVLFISAKDAKKKILIITATSLSIYTAEETNGVIAREIILAKRIAIDDFVYLKSKKILIIKSSVNFLMLNVNNIEENKAMTISFQVKSLLNISKFFIEDIYDRSYFIHFTEGQVQLINLRSVNKVEKIILIIMLNSY